MLHGEELPGASTSRRPQKRKKNQYEKSLLQRLTFLNLNYKSDGTDARFDQIECCNCCESSSRPPPNNAAASRFHILSSKRLSRRLPADLPSFLSHETGRADAVPFYNIRSHFMLGCPTRCWFCPRFPQLRI